jgi:S1-C subfamily serine protease
MVKGEDDSVYVRYAIETELLSPTRKFGVPITRELAKKEEFASPVIWIIEGKDEKGNTIVSGTAFSLYGVGVVSSKHTFVNPQAQSVKFWEISNAFKRHLSSRIQGYRSHPQYDLTVLDCAVNHIGSFKRGESGLLNIGDEAWVMGFPRYHSPGDSLFIVSTKIAQKRKISLVNYLLTTADIAEGNSGGPLLDNKGFAIGVVLFDPSNASLPRGAIDIQHIGEVLTSSIHYF